MRKLTKIFVLFAAAGMIFSCSKDVVPVESQLQSSPMLKGGNKGCTTIQSGTLLASDGSVIKTGFDKWGYNYQAMMFNGFFDNNGRPSTVATSGDELIMKWNAAWLSNTDCDGDGKLDRHFGFPSYIGSGAWLTNHQSGTYIDEISGETIKWTYFSKIVAAPADATLVSGVWHAADGTEIGPDIWGEFAVIQEISNDPGTGDHGKLYISPDHAGFGGW